MSEEQKGTEKAVKIMPSRGESMVCYMPIGVIVMIILYMYYVANSGIKIEGRYLCYVVANILAIFVYFMVLIFRTNDFFEYRVTINKRGISKRAKNGAREFGEWEDLLWIRWYPRMRRGESPFYVVYAFGNGMRLRLLTLPGSTEKTLTATKWIAGDNPVVREHLADWHGHFPFFGIQTGSLGRILYGQQPFGEHHLSTKD